MTPADSPKNHSEPMTPLFAAHSEDAKNPSAPVAVVDQLSPAFDVSMKKLSGKHKERLSRARASSLWAAYGDALGFISELTDERGVVRRTGGQPLDRLVSWSRRVGGRGGVTVQLPSGCYSDDTQLRLATGRAVSGKGFDVEAFAKVELTVWPSYALGGGRATKAAASQLAKTSSAWFANNYEGWLNAGGNGVAMRIQPHVWASPDLDDPVAYAIDVMRNGVCTHANPRALVGAVLHAGCLAAAMRTGRVSSPGDVGELIDISHSVEHLLRSDPELAELWLPMWERNAGKDFGDAWRNAVSEIERAFDVAMRIVESSAVEPEETYRDLLRELSLYNVESRGSGILTVIASVALGWIESRPQEAVRIAANAVGSDTDTIATMAGAVLGAAAANFPAEAVQDEELIIREADRLSFVALGAAGTGHRYPDLLKWLAPRTQADALGQSDEGLVVAGLGAVESVLSEPVSAARGDAAWQWVMLTSGQTVLIKRRSTPPRSQDAEPVWRSTVSQVKSIDDTVIEREIMSAKSSPGDFALEPKERNVNEGPLELDVILGWLNHKRYDDEAVGYAIRRVSLQGTGDQLIALAAAIRERLRNRK